MKKTLSVLLAFIMVLSVITVAPLTVGALTRNMYGEWEYEVWNFYDSNTNTSHEEICITNYTGSAEKVTIPNEIDGKPVTYLYNNYVYGNVETTFTDNGERHFANHETMTELTIPENLKFIAGSMLMDCTKLKTIKISSNNKYFEFKSGVLYMKDGTKTWGDHVGYHNDDINDEYGPVFCDFSEGVVNLPTKTTTIYAYAFYNHTKLMNCVMQPAIGKIQKIEDYAFYNSGIRGEENTDGYCTVIIPYGVKSIGLSAFMNCLGIHAVNLPETLKSVGAQAFLETNCVSFHLPSKLETVGSQAFGYSGQKVNIYGTARVVKLVKDSMNYQSSDVDIPGDSSGGGSGGAIMIHHDPDKPWDHFYVGAASIPPTCTTPGLNIYICECGHIYYGLDTIIQPTGHNWTEKKVNATCTEQGYTLHTCKNCGESYKDNYTKVRNHYKVKIPAVEPTATKAGNTEGQYCERCGTVFVQSELIPPTGYTEKTDNGVKVTAEPEAAPKVSEVTDENVIGGLKLDEDEKADKVYDIKLEKNGETVQPEGDVIVKIPCDDKDAKVYHQEEDGTLTDMNAYNEEGSKVFKTSSFSLFVVASHVPEKYKLWVNNEQLSEDHLTVQCGEGTATFDPKENVLTLDNAQITKGAEKDNLGTGILSFLDDELTIVVNGNCSITETGGDGIGSYEFDEEYNMVPHDFTVKGDGKLTINESTANYGYGIYCTGNLKLEGVDIDINSAAAGVWTNNALNVMDSKININCTTKFSGFVVNDGSAVFDNSNVVAESAEGVGMLLGNDQKSSSVMVNSGSVTLKGKGGVGSDTEHSRVCVTGGKLIIEAQDAAFSPEILNHEGNIVLGEGVEVLSGDLNSASVTIGSTVEPTTDPTNPTDPTSPTSTETSATETSSSTEESSSSDVTEPTNPTDPTSPTQVTEPSESTNPTEPTTPVATAKINKTKANLNAGKTLALKVTNGTVKKWTTSNKKVATVKKGTVTALKKGSVTITATLNTGKKLTCKVKVKTSPKLSAKTVTLKKNTIVTVKIVGKAKSVKNVYTNTKYAKIVSSRTASKIKVKGIKKGTATLKVKVNGVTLKLKVKVK